MFSCDENVYTIIDPYVEQVIDLVASYHVTFYKEIFTTYKASDFRQVKVDNNSFANIIGVRDIHLKTNVGYTFTLKEVRYVQNLRLNMISTHALDRVDFHNHFRDGKWKLMKGSLIVARGNLSSTLYKTQMKLLRKEMHTLENVTSPNL